MLDEWTTYNKTHRDEDNSPAAIFKNDYHNFETYLQHLEIKNFDGTFVPDSVFFALEEERNIFVGAVNIRHCLTPYLKTIGGNIGLGTRPSERRKGYATQMLALALNECKKLGRSKVLITCKKGNIGSEKAIMKNGGIKENEAKDQNRIYNRY